MDDHVPLDISASDSILQAGIGERVKLVPPSALVFKPVQGLFLMLTETDPRSYQK
jgi:hypothetical protein